MSRDPILFAEQDVRRLIGALRFLTAAGLIGLFMSVPSLIWSETGLISIVMHILFLVGLSKLKHALHLMIAEETETAPTRTAPAVTPKFGFNATPLAMKEPVVSVRPKPTVSKESWTKNVDWEQWVGQKLLQKAGIIIVLIGMVVLLKYSFDNRWIDELGRLVLAALVGIVLLGTGEFFRKKYPAWSNGFTGGGLILLYFTVWAAHVFYASILQTKYGIAITPGMALALYSAITAVSVLAAIRYSSQVVAWFAIVGGYLTPLLIETAQPDLSGLTMYLAILTGGLLALSWKKQWKIVHIASFILTQLYLFGSIYPANTVAGISNMQQIIIAIGFFLLFGLVPVLSQLQKTSVTNITDIVLIGANGLFVFLPVTNALGGWQSEWTTLVSLGLAAVYVALSGFALKKNGDALLVNSYMTGGIGLIALALFKQMGMQWFAAGFGPYSLLLAYIAVHTKRKTPYACGIVIMSFALVGIFVNLPVFHMTAETIWRPFASNWSLLSYVVIGSLIGWMYAARSLPDAIRESFTTLARVSHIAVAIIAFAAVTFESTQLQFHITPTLSFAYLAFAGIAACIFLLTAETVWFVVAMMVQILVLLFTFVFGPTALSLPGAFDATRFASLTPLIHPWAFVSVLSLAVLAGLFFVSRKTTSADVRTPAVGHLIITLILAQVWMHVTIEIHNASLALLWPTALFQRLLTGWWIVFALGLLTQRRFKRVKEVGIALLILPLLKDIGLMIVGSVGFYETFLWSLFPLAFAAVGARLRDHDLVRAGVIMLGVTTFVDMVTHLGLYEASLLRSVWWAAIGLLALIAGFVERERLLRHLAMGIFGGATVKLLIFDFNVLETPVRIGASIGTGLLMIGGSYLYQRFSSRLDN